MLARERNLIFIAALHQIITSRFAGGHPGEATSALRQPAAVIIFIYLFIYLSFYLFIYLFLFYL